MLRSTCTIMKFSPKKQEYSIVFRLERETRELMGQSPLQEGGLTLNPQPLTKKNPACLFILWLHVQFYFYQHLFVS